jgi:hypothetical protein
MYPNTPSLASTSTQYPHSSRQARAGLYLSCIIFCFFFSFVHGIRLDSPDGVSTEARSWLVCRMPQTKLWATHFRCKSHFIRHQSYRARSPACRLGTRICNPSTGGHTLHIARQCHNSPCTRAASACPSSTGPTRNCSMHRGLIPLYLVPKHLIPLRFSSASIVSFTNDLRDSLSAHWTELTPYPTRNTTGHVLRYPYRFVWAFRASLLAFHLFSCLLLLQTHDCHDTEI